MTSHDLVQDLIAAIIAVVVGWLTSKFTLERAAAKRSKYQQPPTPGGPQK